MDGSPNIPYVIVEDAAYTQKAIEILGDQRIVDEKLRDLIWGLPGFQQRFQGFRVRQYFGLFMMVNRG